MELQVDLEQIIRAHKECNMRDCVTSFALGLHRENLAFEWVRTIEQREEPRDFDHTLVITAHFIRCSIIKYISEILEVQ